MDIHALAPLRTLALPAGCLLLPTLTAALLVRHLVHRSRHLRAPAHLSRKRLLWFAALALASAGAAAYFAYATALRSYRDWLRGTYPAHLDGLVAGLPPLARVMHSLGIESLPEKKLKQQRLLGGTTVVSAELLAQWLRETDVLAELGGAAGATPAAAWWLQQLLLVLPPWSLFLGWQGRRYRVAHVWAFLLLAHTGSVALAMSLFFVAVILSPLRKPVELIRVPVVVERTAVDAPAAVATTKRQWAFKERASFLDTRHVSTSAPLAWLLALSVLVSLASIPFVPALVEAPYSLPLAAAPHLLLYLPTLLPTMSPDRLWSTYKLLFLLSFVIQVLALAAIVAQIDTRGPFGQSLVLSAANLRAAPRSALAALRAGAGPRMRLRLGPLFPLHRSTVDRALAGLDHYVRALNAWAPAAYGGVARAAAELYADPRLALAWARAAAKTAQVAGVLLYDALRAHPVVAAVGADALLCWACVASWVGTASGFDDELAAESLSPAVEAQNTLNGLLPESSSAAGGAHPQPVRRSWFESHIG